MELYIIRHGETDYNKNNIIQGRGIDSSLNENGHKQAALFYKAYCNENFDIICHSSLQRTFQTIQSFQNSNIPFQSFKELDELDWGDQEGQPQDEANKKKFYTITSEWLKGNYDLKNEKGESPLEVSNRLSEFIQWLLQTPYKKVLICTHGRAMRILLCNLLGKELKEMDLFEHKNLSLYRLRKVENKATFEIIEHNSLGHLRAE